MTDVLDRLAEGVADRLWQRIQAQDRLDALDEGIEGPTCVERLARDHGALADAVDEALGAVLAAAADPGGRRALRGLCDRQAAEASPPPPAVEELLRAGLAVATWAGDGVAASDAGRALACLCDQVSARVVELVELRLRGRDGR
jgi:hypothetical protein